MRKHLTCTASNGLVLFVGSRLAILVIGISAFSVAQSPEPTPSAPPTATLPPPGLTFSLHATNLADQFTRITALQNDEEAALCDALTTYGCDGTNAARCTAIVNYCDALDGLDDGIVDALQGAMAVYELGFTELETACEETIARGNPLDDDRMRLRAAYRTVLFEHIDDLGQRLLERNEALETLRAAAREIGDEAMLAKLRLDERHDLVREALDASIQSLQVVQLIIEDDPSPDTTQGDVVLPSCGGDMRCWTI